MGVSKRMAALVDDGLTLKWFDKAQAILLLEFNDYSRLWLTRNSALVLEHDARNSEDLCAERRCQRIDIAEALRLCVLSVADFPDEIEHMMVGMEI